MITTFYKTTAIITALSPLKKEIMSNPVFSYSLDQLKQLARDVLRYATEAGASDAAVQISEGNGLSVSIRNGQLETIEQNKDKSIGVVVYIGERPHARNGSASTSDFSQQALKDTVKAAYNIARFTAEDDCAGLPETLFLEMQPRELHLYYPWEIMPTEAAELAKRCEAAGFSVDKRISNSEGASVYAHHSHFVAANSRGFIGGYPSSHHSLSASFIAGKGQHMQRDGWYSSRRNAQQLASPEDIGRYGAERALARLHARKLSTRTCPVLFEAPLAVGLLGACVQALSGGSLYRKSSFLLDSLGKQIFPSHIQIREEAHTPGAMGSSPFDDEGVKTRDRDVIKNGVVQGYFLSSYSGRKLNMPTTGNAGGSHNLALQSTLTKPADDFSAMLKKLDTGLLVTDLMGQGVNYVTGDYSRGASGYWVERGVIQYPVEEITIAGNMKEMFDQIVATGSDVFLRGAKQSGSVLIEKMVIAGS